MSKKVYVVTEEDLKIFRDWISKTPYLPQDEDDDYLKIFIIGAKGSIETAKMRFNNFYKSAQTMPELYHDFDPLPKRLENFHKICGLCRIPKDGGNLIVTKLLSDDPTHYYVAEYFVQQFMNMQLMLWENTVGNGTVEMIVDTTGITLGHYKNLTVPLAEKLMSCVLKANPVRIKGIHVYNLPPVFEWVFNLFMKLMTEKLRSRVRLHSSEKSLQDAIPKQYLPKDYGGDQPSVEELYEDHKAHLRMHRQRFLDQKAKRDAELAKRPKDSNDEVSGTFRKLAID